MRGHFFLLNLTYDVLLHAASWLIENELLHIMAALLQNTPQVIISFQMHAHGGIHI